MFYCRTIGIQIFHPFDRRLVFFSSSSSCKHFFFMFFESYCNFSLLKKVWNFLKISVDICKCPSCWAVIHCHAKSKRPVILCTGQTVFSPYYLVVTVYWILSRGSRFSQINAALALEISNPNLLKAFFDNFSVSPEFKSFFKFSICT